LLLRSKAALLTVARSGVISTGHEAGSRKSSPRFRTVGDELGQQFTSKPAVDVANSIEIEATPNHGIHDNVQRTVMENCDTLSFANADIEDESN